MRVPLLSTLALLLLVPLPGTAAPPDVRALWEPPPHPSIPSREPVLTETTAPRVDPPAGAPNFVLVTIDTWRADRLNLYGAPRATSDFLNELAKDSVVFERAVAPSSWTWPTMASIASGMHPRSHGAVKPDAPLCKEVTTIAEVMHGAGWRTGFVGSNTYFEQFKDGYSQGFEFYFASGNEAATRILEYSGYFLEPIYGQPFFMHTHFFDPHCPYDPPSSSLAALQDVPVTPTDATDAEIGPLGWQNIAHPCHAVPPMEEGATPQSHPVEDKASRYLEQYDGELHEMDGQLELLKLTLAANSAWDNSWVVVTGDHGEEFGEHGRVGHGDNVYAETTWVPLIVRPPGGIEGGRRVSTPVSLVDVPATVVKAMGLAVPDSWTGRDLSAVFEGGTIAPAPVLSETIYKNDSWQAMVQHRDRRFMTGGLLPIGEMYGDRMDRTDLIEDQPSDRMRIDAAMMAGRLRAELDATNKARVCDVGSMELDPILWEQLKSMGYTIEVDPANRVRPLPVPPSTIESDCANGKDDDGDGLIDCQDHPDCNTHPNCRE